MFARRCVIDGGWIINRRLAFNVTNESLVHADIENMWVGILLWFKHLDVVLVFIEQAVDLAVWIFKVTDYARAADTGFYTSG